MDPPPPPSWPAWPAWLAAAPVPALLLDDAFRTLEVNAALLALLGGPRERWICRDPVEFVAEADRAALRADRAAAAAAPANDPRPGAVRLHARVPHRDGTLRACTLDLQRLAAGQAGPGAGWLAWLQDLSGEVDARESVRRVQGEFDQWFELAHVGMVLYDHTGLILRSNRTFEALVGRVPELLAEAAPELQALLGWQDGAPLASLVPGAPAQSRDAIVPLPDGRRRRLAARLACWPGDAADAGARRVMAVLEDRSAEDERDLAQLEIGMLMQTASVGVATYDPAQGWLGPGRNAAAAVPASPATPSGALMSIGRDLVEPASRAEYERLQAALRAGTRAEVRYAVRHPELGARWLLTRVEPQVLPGGRRTTSVVTLDVTEQESAERRNRQLLHELGSILDSSPAGIASLRGPTLVRCNRRFERMMGYGAGQAAGATLEEMLARQGVDAARRREIRDALESGRPFEVELPLPAGAGRGGVRWVALSLRRADPGVPGPETVAVLTDVTRLKTQQSELEQLLRERDLMFDLSEVGICWLRGARIERANQALAALTGYSAPELTALDPAELYVDARECVAFVAAIARGLATTGRFVGERRLRRRDGTLRWVLVSVRAAAEHTGAAGEALVAGADTSAPAPAHGASAASASTPFDGGAICSFVDVDERHRARESLARQAERTRAVLNSVLVGIVTVSAGGIEWMNRSARRMFGGELADFVGESIATVATPEPEHPLRREDWMARLGEGQSETFECQLRGRDGRQFWVVGNVVRSGGEGEDRQLTFALLDIERRRQAELRIAQAQASLQRVIETAPLAIALFDARTLRALQVNQAAAPFFGRAAEEVTGRLLPECLDAEAAGRLQAWLSAATGSAEPARHEWPSGARVWDCRIAPLASPAGEAGPRVEQILLVASDVTEQRAAEQARLQAAIAQREVLVREVHHRIKNNLQGVAGLLQQAATRHPDLAGALAEAVGQVQAIAQVHGLQVGAEGPLGVAALVHAVAQSVQRTFGREIVVDAGGVPHLLPEAEAIPVALTLNELFTNAIKHGLGGPVRCEVAALGAADGAGEGVSIRVASRSRLAPGFDLARLRSGVSGLGLVRALLPRRGAAFALEAVGEDVVARVELRAPGVRLDR